MHPYDSAVIPMDQTSDFAVMLAGSVKHYGHGPIFPFFFFFSPLTVSWAFRSAEKAGVQVCGKCRCTVVGSADVQVHRCASVQMYRCVDVQGVDV